MLINADVIDAFQNWDQPRVQAVLGDTPYALISQTKRFGKADAAPPKPGVYQRQAKGFMGQNWDGWNTLAEYQEWVTQWGALLIEKVVYPGAVGLFFGGSRTYHRLACGLEDAGWEIADCIMVWWYANGFPKSHDISKAIDRKAGAKREVVGKGRSGLSRSVLNAALHPESFGGEFDISSPATSDAKAWEGYGTALKPSYEPIVVARAPKGKLSYVDCALQYGTGGLNIDGARIPAPDSLLAEKYASVEDCAPANNVIYEPDTRERKAEPHEGGRYPSNTIIVANEDEYLPHFQDGSRIVYIAKAPTWEREAGLEGFTPETVDDGRDTPADNAYQRGSTLRHNPHPTVKPIQLTEYLARLLLPPRRDNPRRILIPFAGVGSEMIGARFAGWEEIIGVEREASYIPYNEARRKWWGQFATYAQAERLYAAPKQNEGQMTLF